MTSITIRTVDPEVQRTALVSNPLFILLRGSTPAQVNAYLTANVTNIATLQPVLLMLLEGLQYLVNKETP